MIAQRQSTHFYIFYIFKKHSYIKRDLQWSSLLSVCTSVFGFADAILLESLGYLVPSCRYFRASHPFHIDCHKILVLRFTFKYKTIFQL